MVVFCKFFKILDELQPTHSCTYVCMYVCMYVASPIFYCGVYLRGNGIYYPIAYRVWLLDLFIFFHCIYLIFKVVTWTVGLLLENLEILYK